MGLTRKSKFGLMPGVAAPSTGTVRMVPLTTGGSQADQPWPNRVPSSAGSLVNFLPMDGMLTPRSRLSSLNTLRTLGTDLRGVAVRHLTNGSAPEAWVSAGTLHGRLSSLGSISLASFTSAFGLGVAGLPTQAGWTYAEVYMAGIDNNALVAAGTGSLNTLLALYDVVGTYRVSYLTSAPRAAFVTSFDNYVVAWNIGNGANAAFDTRVQWCQRGSPSNWTGEGSGFEDLLQMRGYGTAIHSTADGRLILFGSEQIWYGLGATYPAQFQFAVLDPQVGCHAGRTVQETGEGLMFLGSDNALRLLPSGGGRSQVVVPSLAPVLRRNHNPGQAIYNNSWAAFDSFTKMYHLFLNGSGGPNFIVNTRTGEWGYAEYGAIGFLGHGVSMAHSRRQYSQNEGLFVVNNSTGTVYSTNSLLATDSGSTVTSTFRSEPIGAELPGNYKQVVQADCDYRATSRATVTLKVSQDGGNSYGYTAMPLSLLSAPVTGRATSHLYAGGGFPCIELTSTDTGFDLHRLDVTINTGGQR
jgi:hypothetical protein